MNELAETERELALVRDRVLEVVRPWYEETCARRRAHESTVVVETGEATLRISFQHRYTKLSLDREDQIKKALGDDYERYFKRLVSLKLKKEMRTEAANVVAQKLRDARVGGAGTAESVYLWSRRWLEAELTLAEPLAIRQHAHFVDGAPERRGHGLSAHERRAGARSVR